MNALDRRAGNTADGLRGFVGALMDGSRKKAFFFDVDRALPGGGFTEVAPEDDGETKALVRTLARVNDGGVALYGDRSPAPSAQHLVDLTRSFSSGSGNVSLLVGIGPSSLVALMSTPRFANRIPFLFTGAPVDGDLADAIHARGGRIAEVASVGSIGTDVALSGAADVLWLIRDFIALNAEAPPIGGVLDT